MPVPIARRLPTPVIALLLPVKRMVFRIMRAALLRWARAAKPRRDEDPSRKVFILLVSAWGMGGTIRAAINLAGHLVGHHDVEILSAYRRRERPNFPFAPGVKVTALDDERPGREPRRLGLLRAVLRRRGSVLVHPADVRYRDFSLWTDIQLLRRLRGQAGIVMGTRPGLNILAADLGLPGLTSVGVEQMHLRAHGRNLRTAMIRRYQDLDGLAVLTDDDMNEYRAVLNGSVPLWRIPNTVHDIGPPQADPSAKRILAAGRLTAQKGFDMLIPAFAPVARAHPDWELRICGWGQAKPRLQELVAEEGIRDQVTLAGPTDDVPGEMSRASIYALSSRYEGFPLVLIEAMSKGMAVVAFDCPTGPGELIDDHRNGILVPARDVEGLTAGLLEMVRDEGLRRRCGAAALETARAYTMAAVGPQWDAMLEEVVRRRAALR